MAALLGHKKRRQICPLYVAGLIGSGERKSMQPMAERFGSARYDRFHHFISDGLWDDGLLKTELARTADRLVGGPDAVLVIDDTGLPKKGRRSVGARRNTLPCWASAPTARPWFPCACSCQRAGPMMSPA